MTVKSAPYYTIYCDFPGCGATPHDFGSEYGAWVDEGQALDEAECSEWAVDTGKGDFCPNHVVMNEDGEWVPAENTIEQLVGELHRTLLRRIDSEFRMAANVVSGHQGSYRWKR